MLGQLQMRGKAHAEHSLVIHAGLAEKITVVSKLVVPLPLLYTYRRCPYAMRARMALLVAQRSFNAFEISLRDKPAALLALSAKGTVPVLQLADGQVLDESWDIMRWALHGAADSGWWHLANSPENLDLLRCNDSEFKPWLDRYKYPERHGLDTVARETVRRLAVDSFLISVETRLRSQAYLGGTAPCATDLAIFPFVRQFAAVDPYWFEAQELPFLRAWLAVWLRSPLFAACMFKLDPQTPLHFKPLTA